jgi:hypothetical protein
LWPAISRVLVGQSPLQVDVPELVHTAYLPQDVAAFRDHLLVVRRDWATAAGPDEISRGGTPPRHRMPAVTPP